MFYTLIEQALYTNDVKCILLNKSFHRFRFNLTALSRNILLKIIFIG